MYQNPLNSGLSLRKQPSNASSQDPYNSNASSIGHIQRQPAHDGYYPAHQPAPDDHVSPFSQYGFSPPFGHGYGQQAAQQDPRISYGKPPAQPSFAQPQHQAQKLELQQFPREQKTTSNTHHFADPQEEQPQNEPPLPRRSLENKLSSPLMNSKLFDNTSKDTITTVVIIDLVLAVVTLLSSLILMTDSWLWVLLAVASLITFCWSVISLWILNKNNMIYPSSNAILRNYSTWRIVFSCILFVSLIICGVIAMKDPVVRDLTAEQREKVTEKANSDSNSYLLFSLYFLLAILFFLFSAPNLFRTVAQWKSFGEYESFDNA